MKFKLLEMTRLRNGEYSSNNLTQKQKPDTPLKIRFAYIAIEIEKIRERLGK